MKRHSAPPCSLHNSFFGFSHIAKFKCASVRVELCKIRALQCESKGKNLKVMEIVVRISAIYILIVCESRIAITLSKH